MAKRRKNLFGFGGKPKKKAMKKSSMTFGQAMHAAFAAGEKSGDTGHFDEWLDSKGLSERSSLQREKLEKEFSRGVVAPIVKKRAKADTDEMAAWKKQKDAEMAEFMKGSKGRMQESMRKSAPKRNPRVLVGTYPVRSTAEKVARLQKGTIVPKGKGFEVWRNASKVAAKKSAVKTKTAKKAVTNPINVATMKQGSAKAVVSLAGFNKYRVTITKGSEKLEDTFTGLKPAMAFARVRLHDVAQNPSLKKLGKAIKRAAKSASQMITGRNRKNPVSAAEKTFEEFHGIPSQEVIEYQTQHHYHSVTASIGKLICLQLIDVNGKPLDIICEGWSWHGPKSELAQGAKMAKTSGWDFDPETKIEDIVMLTTAEDGKQLFIQGGDQKIDVKSLGFDDRDIHDHMLLGTIWRLWYRTKKSFEANGEDVDFYHALGKEGSGGVCPVLIYKPRNPSLEVSGGRYYIAPPEAELGDASPGIVG